MHSYLPCINIPTRVTETSATLIDNFFVKNKNPSMKAAVIYTDISDHYPIMLQLIDQNKKSKPPKTVTKRIFDPVSINKFCIALNKQDNWNDVYNIINDSNDTNAAMGAFERNYQDHF